MTFEELLIACSCGKMPTVELIGKPVKFSNQNLGVVTTIKDNGRHRGVAVKFKDLDYDTWFHDLDDTDKRSRYMRELKIV